MKDWTYLIQTKKLDESELREIYMHVDLRTLLKTQTLSLDFIFDIILNEQNQKSVEETYITEADVILYQKYTKDDICQYKKNKQKK